VKNRSVNQVEPNKRRRKGWPIEKSKRGLPINATNKKGQSRRARDPPIEATNRKEVGQSS